MHTDLIRDRQQAFIRSLDADLRILGLNVNSLPLLPLTQSDYQGRRLCEQNREADLLLAAANSREDSPVPASRSEVQPTLHFCSSAADNRLYESLRLLQHVPSGRRLGRQVRVLVYDSAPTSPLLIGAFGLASPLYRLGCRDRVLGWEGSSNSEIRHFGLRRTMDLAVCVTTPTYSGMRITKLLAMLAVSAPVVERYSLRYGEPLLAVVTTCASGSHCACFNRIMVRRGGLFRKVGETAGYTTSHFSNATIRAARELVLGPRMISDVMRSHAEALPVLRTAMRRLRLPHERLLRMGIPKAVYMAECFPGALSVLRAAASTKSGSYLTVDEAVKFWRSRISSMHLAKPAEAN